jgi:hypothetical protein
MSEKAFGLTLEEHSFEGLQFISRNLNLRDPNSCGKGALFDYALTFERSLGLNTDCVNRITELMKELSRHDHRSYDIKCNLLQIFGEMTIIEGNPDPELESSSPDAETGFCDVCLEGRPIANFPQLASDFEKGAQDRYLASCLL